MKTTFNETGMQTIPRKEANRKIPTGSTWKGKINKKEGKKNTVLCADWFWRPSFTRGPYPSITAFTQLAAAAREKKENKTRNRRRAKTTPGAQLSLLSFSLTDSHHHHQGLINQSNTFRFPILSLSLSLSLSLRFCSKTKILSSNEVDASMRKRQKERKFWLRREKNGQNFAMAMYFVILITGSKIVNKNNSN